MSVDGFEVGVLVVIPLPQRGEYFEGGLQAQGEKGCLVRMVEIFRQQSPPHSNHPPILSAKMSLLMRLGYWRRRGFFDAMVWGEI